MSTKSDTISADGEPINLKHRITGAGVLIFFGVLVLPWLLGPPSEAVKDATELSSNVEVRHSTFEDEIIAELEGIDADQFEEPEETVYVSKITPLSGDSILSDPEPLVEAPTQTTEKPVSETATLTSESKTEAKTEQSAKSVKSNEKVEQASVAAANPKTSENSAKIPETKPVETAVTVAKAPKIDVGWVVQVELLTDKNGAKRLVDQLRDKGFSPSTTTVDTNRGKNTGTRIWLGPFAQRAEAGVENEKLAEKMGKRGFIRVYP